MSKGPKVEFPQPTPEQKNLEQEQAGLLRQQRDILAQQLREQQLIAPTLYGQAGLAPQFNERGELVALNEDPTQKAIREGISGRTLAALRGELPIDPILSRELGQQENTLREALRKQLGPGFETSTAGIEALQKQREGRAGILHGASRGELTMGEALGLTRQQAGQDAMMRAMDPGRNLASLFGGAAAGYNTPIGLQLQGRGAEFQGRLATYQRALNDPFSSRNLGQRALNQFDTITQQATGAAFGMMSTARVKKDIVPLDKEGSSALKKLPPMFHWKYQWEGAEREPHTGPILELSPKEMRASDTHISLGDWLGLTTQAVKEVDRKVESLRDSLGRA